MFRPDTSTQFSFIQYTEIVPNNKDLVNSMGIVGRGIGGWQVYDNGTFSGKVVVGDRRS